MPSGKTLPGGTRGSRVKRTSLRSSASSTPSPTRTRVSRKSRSIVKDINGVVLEETDITLIKGLNSPHHASHGSSVEDSDASTKEDEPPPGDFTHVIHKQDFTDLIDKEDNHLTSKVNGSSSSPFIMIEKLPYMNGDHDHTSTDDIEELNHDDVNNSTDSINAHAIIQSASETTNGVEDSHYASNEHYPIEFNYTKPVVTEIETEDFNSNSKEDTTSASDGILSPIKPIAVEGNITTLSDAILISPPKLEEERKDRNITVNLANSSLDNCMEIEDEFLCESPLPSPTSQTKLDKVELVDCMEEDSVIQGFLEVVPESEPPSTLEEPADSNYSLDINSKSCLDTLSLTDPGSKSPGSVDSQSQVPSLRASPTLDVKPDCLTPPSHAKRAVRSSRKVASRKSSIQSPIISRSSSIDSSGGGMEVSQEMPEPVKTKCDQLKSKIKGRRGSVKKEAGTAIKSDLNDTSDVKNELPVKVEVKVELSEEEKQRNAEEDRKEVEKRLKSFKHITENHYLCPKKINKQFRKMQCDCEPKEDESIGCGDDCANKMLMIECGKDCLLEKQCGNKRFQNKENARIEVFRTDWKGVGVRATQFIPKDTFIMEYVGEALDHKQFRRQAKQYSRNNVEHFYFMALSNNCYVDATNKGNISRFINHSCDPNSETQKWIVNGESRVGFFTRRDVQPLEELNFDYKYERYGQAAQKCYCGTSLCRGWLGKEPTTDSGIDEAEEWTTSEEEDEEEVGEDTEVSGKQKEPKSKVYKKREDKDGKREKRRRKAEERRRWQEEEEWNEEIHRLDSSGIKNRIHTLQLCRLMVRASTTESRSRLAQLLLAADQPCKRLFLDYQGLRILSQWMQDLEWSLPDLQLKLQIESMLAELPIPHRTMLKDTKVWSTVQLWSVATKDNPNPNISTNSKTIPRIDKSKVNELKRIDSSSGRGSSTTTTITMTGSSAASSTTTTSTPPPPASDISTESLRQTMLAAKKFLETTGSPLLPYNNSSIQQPLPQPPLQQQQPSGPKFEEDLCPPGEEELSTPSPAPDQEQYTPAITPAETPSISPTPDGSKLASPGQEQEEPGSTLKTCDLNNSSESDIQILKELTYNSQNSRTSSRAPSKESAEHTSRAPRTNRIGSRTTSQDSRPSSRSSDNMKLKVVSDTEVFTKGSESAKALTKVLTNQSDAGPEDMESGLDVIVLPNHREELPPDEDEETTFIISQILKIQEKASDLLKTWSQLQEVFKIPKKERHKLRVEHEREVDRYYNQHRNQGFNARLTQQRLPVFMTPSRNNINSPADPQRNNSYDLSRTSYNYHSPVMIQQQQQQQSHSIPVLIHQTPDRATELYRSQQEQQHRSALTASGASSNASHKNRYQSQNFQYDRPRLTVVVPRERKNLRLDDKQGRLHMHGLSRDQRRNLFAEKIKEEARQKELRNAILSRHHYYCRILGLRLDSTPLFDNYPEYYYAGDKWVQMPKGPEVPADANFIAPTMAWLPDEAYKATDPKPVCARDIYPPGICPAPAPPKPRIIRVPGAESTEWEVMLYYEEMYRREPKSEPSSPKAPSQEFGDFDLPPVKPKIPPYPGYNIPTTPQVIFFDPELCKPAPPPKEEAKASPAEPVPVPVPGPVPPPGSGTATPLPTPGSTPLHTGSGTGTPLPSTPIHTASSSVSSGTPQQPGTPLPTLPGSRPESRASLSSAIGVVTPSLKQCLNTTPSATSKRSIQSSTSTSNNKRKHPPTSDSSEVLSSSTKPSWKPLTEIATITPSKPEGEGQWKPLTEITTITPSRPESQRKRRSLEAELNVSGNASSSDSTNLMARIREELKLGLGGEEMDELMSPPELSPDYRSPSPVHRRNSTESSPSPTPLQGSGIHAEPNSTTTQETRVTIKRTAPRTIDLTNSESLITGSMPFQDAGGRSVLRQEARQAGEFELCDSLSLHQNVDVGAPLASTITQVNTNNWTSDTIEASGVPTDTNATQNGGDLVVRLPRSWRTARDGSGRVYYYHVDERVAQWDPPSQQQDQYNQYPTSSSDETVTRDDVEMETNSSDSDEEDNEGDSDEEKENGDEETEPIEERELVPDYDLSASEKKMLLRVRDKSQSAKMERSNRRKTKRRAERERREQQREMLEARSERHRTTGLVTEILIPRDQNNSVAKEIREKLKNKEEILRQIDEEIMREEISERQEQERLRREQIKAEKAKREVKALPDIDIPITPTVQATNIIATPNKPPPAVVIPGLGGLEETPDRPVATSSAVHTAAADTSSEWERKAKEKFIKEMSSVIVKALDPFRNPKSKGYIRSNEDFKHIAKKLTYVIYQKERARAKAGQDIKVTIKMKEKAAEYVKKKMNSYEKEYKRSPQR